MAALNLHHVVDSEWAYLVGLLPVDLDKLAKDTGAIQRRRSVSSRPSTTRLVTRPASSLSPVTTVVAWRSEPSAIR